MMQSSNNQGQAVIKVIGIGGAGGNAINRMIAERVQGVSFVAMNTDAQVLELSKASQKIRLGDISTRGLGAGGDPTLGEAGARESERVIAEMLDGTDMVFLTSGMGGGTGTGAAPVVAEIAKRLNILTVAVVSKPFTFEGPKRRRIAEEGALRLAEQVDTLIVVPNDRLMEVVDKRVSMSEAFEHADDILRQGVQGISDIITKPGLINLDFADVRSVMKEAGSASMGMGRAQGEGRARIAAEMAANSPLLETSLQGARKLLVNLSTGADFNLGEAYEVMEYLHQFVDPDEAEIFLGHVIDQPESTEVRVTVLAAGLGSPVRKTRDAEVFPTSAAARMGERAEGRREQRPIQLEDLDLDIPSYLRSHRATN